MPKYIVVADSGADIPAETAKELGIEIVRMHVTFNSRCLDDGAFPPSQIFDHYAATGELPSTSGSTPHDFSEAFDRIHAEHPEAHIIYLAYSAVTTCSFQSAHLAGEGRDYISYFDTKSVCAGQYLVVTEIARLVRDNPDVTLDEVSKAVKYLVEHVHMAFVPGGLEFLRAGGRVSNAAYLGAQLLHIKPTIEILDGHLVATKKLRGSMDRVVKRLIDNFIEANNPDTKRVVLIRNRGLSQKIQATAEARMQDEGFEEVVWVETGGVISSHCGPGSFGIAAFSR